MSKIKVSAAKWVPPFAQGLVRDLRVRWALEEAGLAYEEILLSQADYNTPEYRTLQPFGQVPAYQEGELVMFESGAIVMHIAEKTEKLMPKDPAGKARTQTWMFAALNSIEIRTSSLLEIDLFNADKEWAEMRRPEVLESLKVRLKDLSNHLEGRDYLEDRFTAGDLLMTSVLRVLRHAPILEEFPILKAYKERCEARPAFQKALAAQVKHFEANAPKA